MLKDVIASIVPAVVLAACSTLQADSPDPAPEAIRKSIPLLEKGSAGSAEQRECFTCHSQGLPVLALVEARRRGFTIDEENLKLQLEHAAAHLKRGITRYLEGRGTGGGYVTAGYALAALEAGGWKPDEATAATCGYRRGLTFLLHNQQNDGSWHVKTRSKPIQTYFESGFPHGKDQFIPIYASSWSTIALLLALSERRQAKGDRSESKHECNRFQTQ